VFLWTPLPHKAGATSLGIFTISSVSLTTVDKIIYHVGESASKLKKLELWCCQHRWSNWRARWSNLSVVFVCWFDKNRWPNGTIRWPNFPTENIAETYFRD